MKDRHLPLHFIPAPKCLPRQPILIKRPFGTNETSHADKHDKGNDDENGGRNLSRPLFSNHCSQVR
jgi:hypothetical protein